MKYDEDYFERGVETGVSLYQNYRWMPEMTIRMAHYVVQHLQLKPKMKVLDYGCAKGYLVKALRILDIYAYGCDISRYAIDHADPEVKDLLEFIPESGIPYNSVFDVIITKDVLEHMTEGALNKFIRQSYLISQRAFHVVPLGNGHGYVIPEYEQDKTHIIRRPVDWWCERFESAGWTVEEMTYRKKGIKEAWTARFPKGNAFFTLSR